MIAFKPLSRILGCALLVCVLIIIVSCDVSKVNVPVSFITLSDSQLELEVGETYEIECVVSPYNASNKRVIWTSSNRAVASVNDGIVVAVKVGKVIIAARSDDGGMTAECEVIVKENLSSGDNDGSGADDGSGDGNNNDELDVTAAIDLSSKGSANCYVVSKTGIYKFKAVQGNGNQSVGDVVSCSVLWETFGTAVKPSVNDLISGVSYKDGYIAFSTPASFKEGNAVIAAKDSKDDILWSWHIWLVQDEIKSCTYVNDAGVLMDRNLGATSVVPGTSASIGLIYQWGRKDPLLPYHKGTGTTTDKVFYDNDRDIRDPNNSSHKDKADPTKTVKEAMVTSKSRKSLSFSINYPHKFIRQTDNGSAETGTPATSTYTDATNLVIYRNWCTNVYINLWNANCTELPMFAYTYEMKADEFHRQFNELVSIPVEKTVYDPSPAGYEMPRFDTFTGATLRGTNTKPYWYYDQNDNGGNDQYFSPLVNILNSTPWWSNAFEFSIRRKPKISEHVYDKAGIESDQGYWTVGMGHRANTGDAAQYANYGAALTSGIACVQWIGDNGNHKNDYPHNYEIQCLRLAYIHGKPDVLTSENIGTGYGTLRPISGSYMDLAFPIIPVKTGCNPVRTEVRVGSDIVDWKPGDNINLEL